MVQIIQRPESTNDRLGNALIALSSSLAQDVPKEMMGRQERKQVGDLMGQDVSNIRSPDLIKQLLGSHLTRQEQAAKLKGEYDAEEKSYSQIKEAYGEKFANVWRAMGQGERTELLKAFHRAGERGLDVDEFLRGGFEGEPPEGLEPRRDRGDSGLPDFTRKPKGRSWSEWTKEMEGWGKKNTEVLTEARDRLKGNKRDMLGTKKLQQLDASKKLPSGFSKFVINPKTGEPYKLAQLTERVEPEVEEWVKEVSRFGNRAKDAFGSRVTNFDLAQYLKQFPSLLNSSEGRRRILRMMEINYELDSLYDKAVQQIIDDFGEDKIPPAQVDKMARRLIKDREEELFDEYLQIESENESSFLREGMSKPSLEDIFSG